MWESILAAVIPVMASAVVTALGLVTRKLLKALEAWANSQEALASVQTDDEIVSLFMDMLESDDGLASTRRTLEKTVQDGRITDAERVMIRESLERAVKVVWRRHGRPIKEAAVRDLVTVLLPRALAWIKDRFGQDD